MSRSSTHAKRSLHSLAMLGHGLILAEPLDVSLSVKECGLGLLAATSGGGEAIVGERAPLLGVTMADAWRLAQSWPWLR